MPALDLDNSVTLTDTFGNVHVINAAFIVRVIYYPNGNASLVLSVGGNVDLAEGTDLDAFSNTAFGASKSAVTAVAAIAAPDQTLASPNLNQRS